MSTYRLCNTSYREVVGCLPLPSLPICFGASSRELCLLEGGDGVSRIRAANSSTIISQASKIAELLKATDISYLSLRDGSRDEASSISEEPGSLLSAILQQDSKAFNYYCPGPNKQMGCQNSSSDGNSQQIERSGVPSENVHGRSLAVPPERTSLDVQTPPSMTKSRIRRKDAIEERLKEGVSSSGALDLEHGTAVGSLCEMLDDIFERNEIPDEGEDNRRGTWLPFLDIKLLSEELMAAHSKNALHLIPIGHIVRLLDLFNCHIQHAHGRAVDEEDEVDSDNFIIVTSALEAVQAALIIMTHHSMPKQVYKEEIIDRIIDFTRHQIVHTVFSAYDPSYRMIHKGGGVEIDDGDNEEEDDAENRSGKKGRRKSKGGRVRKLAFAKVSSCISGVLHKVCSILGLLKDLLSIERLLDSSVLQLIRTSLATFSIDNIQLLQLKAIGVACAVFSSYPEHRTIVMDEIVLLLWKLPSSKRNLRAYHLPDEEDKQIQMITALLLQLVQCSVTLPEFNEDFAVNATSEAADSACSPAKCFEAAMESCRHFWGNVLQRLTVPKSQDISDTKVIVDNLIADLLATLNVPEYPAAGLLLQVLCVLLFGNAGLKSKDLVVRGISIDLLGQIAARIKHDCVVCSNDKLWILQGLHDEEPEAFFVPPTEKCVVCLGERDAKIMVICDGCQRWFHGQCIGLTGHDLIGRSWVCHCCLCRRQLVCLDTHLRSQQEKIRQSHEINKTMIQAVEGCMPITGVNVIQQILLNYLQEVRSTDNTYARRFVFCAKFYLCQWYRDDPGGLQMLPFYHGRWNSTTSILEFANASAVLSRDVITRISAVLGQQRSLARGFDKILDRLLASLQENSPTLRAKALRAVSAIVEADPGVLGDTRVKCAVEGRFLDSAISVREAAMELVGRHIVSRPDVAVKYFKKIAERIMDTGVSVRKRVIKIIRDICMSKCEFGKMTDACFHIISRISDEETSIQDLVCKTFYEMWFEELSDAHGRFVGNGSTIPVEIAERTQQLVDVLSMLNSHQPLVTIIKRTLALDFCPKNTGTSAISQAAVRNRCELMCKCLLESILKAEETNNVESEIRALPYVLALHAFCTVDPSLCAPASDPSCFVVTLHPYLKTQVDNRAVSQLLQSIVFVIDTVLPLLRRPPQNFVEELERDLRQLIVRYSFLSVVHSSIKCLCSLSKVTTKGVTSFEFLLHKFFKYLDTGRNVQFGAIDELHVLRCLFCLGLLGRYGAELIDSLDKQDISVERLLSIYKHYIHLDNVVIKARSLQALGFLCIAKPEIMMEKEVKIILEGSLSSSADTRIKVQALRNFYDYLADVEERMGIANSDNSNKSRKQHEVHVAVPAAAGAGDGNICGGVIQLHWENILENCLDMNDQVRQSALKVVEIVLRQGLVHPMTCVPHLISLEVDQQELNSKMAHSLLIHMNEKYPSFFESRMGDGILLSFRFILSGASSSVNGKISGDLSNNHGRRMSASAKMGISRIYKLIRRSRASRNKFMSSVVHKFDSGILGDSSLQFLVYCAEILATLPFITPDEPLYLVYTINRTLQLRAGSLEANMKKKISEGSLKAIVGRVLEADGADKHLECEDACNAKSVESAADEACKAVDDIQDIPAKDLQNLKDDCHAAVSFVLLLKLKRHVKLVFGLNDARCQAFTPSEPIKSGEALSRQNIPFNIEDIPTFSPTTIHQMLVQYQAFKRALKEDSMDYSAFTASISRKRARSAGSQANIGNVDLQLDGHLPARSLRRKTLFSLPQSAKAGSSEDDDKDDQDWGGEGQKQRRLSRKGRLEKVQH